MHKFTGSCGMGRVKAMALGAVLCGLGAMAHAGGRTPSPSDVGEVGPLGAGFHAQVFTQGNPSGFGTVHQNFFFELTTSGELQGTVEFAESFPGSISVIRLLRNEERLTILPLEEGGAIFSERHRSATFKLPDAPLGSYRLELQLQLPDGSSWIQGTISAVPEPSAMWMTVAGLAAVGVATRHLKSRRGS